MKIAILLTLLAPLALAQDFTDSVFQYSSLTGDCRWIANGNLTYVLDVDSASASFIPGAMNYPAGYDAAFSGIDPTSFFVESLGAEFGDFDFGPILPAGLSSDFVASDLTGVYGVDGVLGDQPIVVQTIGTPEPLTLLPLAALLLCVRARRSSPVE